MVKKTMFPVLTIVAVFTLLVPPVASSVQCGKAEIYLRELCCDKTTELGADEVYILVYGRRTDGATYARRWPGPGVGTPQGHWDMNDNPRLPKNNPRGDSHCITDKSLFVGELSPGQSWDVIVMISEEDGGNSKDIQALVGPLAEKVPNPFVAGAGVVLAALTELGINIKDTDDYVGSLAVHIANNGGNISAKWKKVDRVNGDVGPDPNARAAKECRMNGDGSNYIGWYDIR
jgi:hypothetical protein